MPLPDRYLYMGYLIMLKGYIIKNIERDFVGLSHDEQLELLERLVHLLRDTTKKKACKETMHFKWDEFYGIANGLWEQEDAQDYVNRLREDRI
jgi:hypothetical protein